MFVKFKKSYSCLGSKYAAEGLKYILFMVFFNRKLEQYQPSTPGILAVGSSTQV